MKIIIYVSGILGVILLTLGIIGNFANSTGSQLITFAGLAMLLVLFLPLLLLDRYLHDKKIKEIIDSGKFKNVDVQSEDNVKSESKGWGMNNSPFRERKSGLNWGGGNIHGAKASRGSRKVFWKGS